MSEKKLQELETRVKELNEKRIRTEEQLNLLRKQKDEIIAELTVLDIAPKDLDATITALDESIQKQLTEIRDQLPNA